MDSDLIFIGLLSILIDGFLWGMIGYVLFKSFRIDDRFWILGAIITGLVNFLWEDVLISKMIGEVEIQINNGSASTTLENDITKLELIDVIFPLIATIIGFKISKKIVTNLIHKYYNV